MSNLIPEKYLSVNSVFCDGSVKCVKIPIISRPCSVLDILSSSSIYIIGFIALASIIPSIILPQVDPTYV